MKKLFLAIFLLMASCTPVIAQVNNPKANKVLVAENTGKEYNAYLKNIKKYAVQYQTIVKELAKQGKTVE